MEKSAKRLVCRICQDTFTNPAEHQKDSNHLRLTPGAIRVSGFNFADRDQVMMLVEKMGGVSNSRFAGKYWQVFYEDKKNMNYIIHTPIMFKGKPLEVSWRRPGYGPAVILSTFEANRKRTLEAMKEKKKEAAKGKPEAGAKEKETINKCATEIVQQEQSFLENYCWICIKHYDNFTKHSKSPKHIDLLPGIVRVTVELAVTLLHQRKMSFNHKNSLGLQPLLSSYPEPPLSPFDGRIEDWFDKVDSRRIDGASGSGITPHDNHESSKSQRKKVPTKLVSKQNEQSQTNKIRKLVNEQNKQANLEYLELVTKSRVPLLKPLPRHDKNSINANSQSLPSETHSSKLSKKSRQKIQKRMKKQKLQNIQPIFNPLALRAFLKPPPALPCIGRCKNLDSTNSLGTLPEPLLENSFIFREKSEIFSRIQKLGGVTRHTFDSGKGILEIHYPGRKHEAFDLIKNIGTIYPEKKLTVSWRHDNKWITKSEAEELASDQLPEGITEVNTDQSEAAGAAKKEKSNNMDADVPSNDVAAAEGTIGGNSVPVKTGKTIGDIIRTLKTCDTFDAQLSMLQTEILPDRQLYVAKRDIVFQDLQAILKAAGKKWNSKKLEPICFGSNATGLNTLISDFDIFIASDKPAAKGIQLLKIMTYHMNKIMPGMFVKVYLIENARVPILRCFHKETSTLCDINATHPLGVNNSQLIKYYLNLDPKLTSLALLIKFWAESHGLKKVNQFNTYMLCWMVIFYLQQTYDVPSVHSLQSNNSEFIVDNWNVAFKKIKDYQNEALKNASMTKMLTGFFDFYRKFDFISSVICPYLGRTLAKSDFFSPLNLPDCYMLYQNYTLTTQEFFNPNSFLAIQDPFEHVRNISLNVNSNSVVKFGFLCEIACEVFRSKEQNEILCHMLNPKDLSTMTELSFCINPPQGITSELWFDAVDVMAQCLVEKVLKCELTLIEQPSKPSCLAGVAVTNQIAYYCNGTLSVFEDRLEILRKIGGCRPSFTSDFQQEIAVTIHMTKECPKVVRMLFSMSLFATETGSVVVVIRGSSTCKLLHQVNHFLRVKLPKWTSMFWKKDAQFFGTNVKMEFIEYEPFLDEKVDEKETKNEDEGSNQPPPEKKPQLTVRTDLLEKGVDPISDVTMTKPKEEKVDQEKPQEVEPKLDNYAGFIKADVPTEIVNEDKSVVLAQQSSATVIEPATDPACAVESVATKAEATKPKEISEAQSTELAADHFEPFSKEADQISNVEQIRSKTPDTQLVADQVQRTINVLSTPDKSASDMDVCSTDDDPDGSSCLLLGAPEIPNIGMTPSEKATETQSANMEFVSGTDNTKNASEKSLHTTPPLTTTTSTNETNASQSAKNENVTVSNGKGSDYAEEEEEDVPPDFFDDFSNQDFMDGLDIVDAWDDDCGGGGGGSSSNRAPTQRLEEEGQIISSSEDDITTTPPLPFDPSVVVPSSLEQAKENITTDKSENMKDFRRSPRNERKRRRSSSPKRRNRSPVKKRSSSPRKHSSSPRKRSSRTSSTGVPAERTRRDPERTRRDIEKHKLKCAKDQELKIVTDKLRLMESGLVPPGTEAEYDLNVVLKETRQKDKDKTVLKESPSKIKPSKSPKKKRRSYSRERDRERKRSPLAKSGALNSRSSNSQRDKEWQRFIRRRSHSSSPDNRRRKRSRSRDRSRDRNRSRSPYSKKARRVEHKKSFLEEIRDKLNAIPPSSATSLPVPYPTMPPAPYSQAIASPAPQPVPAPVRYFAPPPVAAVPPPMQQNQLYDQQFFIGGQPYTLNLPLGSSTPASAYPNRVPQQQQQTAAVVGGGLKTVPISQYSPFGGADSGGQRKEQEGVPKPDIDKLFEDKKISLSDFLTITAKPEVQSSTPEHLQKKFKVISRCQDAIRIMSLEKKITGRLNVAPKPPNKLHKPEIKFQSPLRKVPVIRFMFTTPTKSSAADSSGDGYAMAIDKVLQSVGIIQETISLDEDESPPPKAKSDNRALREDESRLAQSLKAKLATISSPLKNTQGHSAALDTSLSGCEECRRRKMKCFTEVAIQCATDVKTTNTIGTQVCEDDLRKRSDSFVHLTPAQLLNKEKENSSIEDKRGDEQKKREDVTPTKDEMTTPIKAPPPKRSPSSGSGRGRGNPRSGRGGGNHEDLRNVLERGNCRPGAPYPHPRGYPPRFPYPMDMVHPDDQIFFNDGYDREYYPPNYYPPPLPRYGDPRF